MRVGTLSGPGGVEARLKRLGVRLIPPEPLTRAGRVLAVEVAAPKLLSPESSEPERADMLAQAFVAVLARRYRINRRYLKQGQLALEAHPDYPRLVQLSRDMLEARVAPLGWVLFSFDRWGQTALGKNHKRPPPAKWVWSVKRWRAQLAWYSEGQYAGVELRTPPLACALWRDWRLMWVQLIHQAPDTREALARIVEAWFPGEAYDERLARARSECLERQLYVDMEQAAGRWPWA